MKENVDNGLSALAERLPNKFQDMTQKGIRSQLDHLERKIERLDDEKDRQRGIVLSKWQVWLAIIAIIVSIIAVVITLQ